MIPTKEKVILKSLLINKILENKIIRVFINYLRRIRVRRSRLHDSISGPETLPEEHFSEIFLAMYLNSRSSDRDSLALRSKTVHDRKSALERGVPVLETGGGTTIPLPIVPGLGMIVGGKSDVGGDKGSKSSLDGDLYIVSVHQVVEVVEGNMGGSPFELVPNEEGVSHVSIEPKAGTKWS